MATRIKTNLISLSLILVALFSYANTHAQTKDDSSFKYGSISEPNNLSIASSNDNTVFSFPITAQICYSSLSHFQTAEGKSLFQEATQLDNKQLKIEYELANLRQEYRSSDNAANQKYIGEEILQQEKQSYALYIQAKELKQKANELEYAYWLNAKQEEKDNFVSHFMPQEEVYAQLSDYANDNLLTGNNFTIYNKKVQTKTTSPQDSNKENQLVYKIQVGRYKNTPKSVQDKFRKLSFIRKIDKQTNSAGETIYTVGELSDFNDALQMQTQLEKDGFSKTKVIAFQGLVEVAINETGTPLNMIENE